jgi:hypothetical protein
MSLPTPAVIKIIAVEYGYEERRAEASNTLFFKDASTAHHPTLINVFYTTGGVMTQLSHPRSGYNELWRSDAYNSATTLADIFANPRMHTGKGYREVGNSTLGCAKCGLKMNRGEFSKNQWRKGPGQAKCCSCVQSHQRGLVSQDLSTEIKWESIIDSITCDAEHCSNPSSALRCTTCCMVYYCSETCKRRHQLAHSPECVDLEQFRNLSDNSDPNLNSGLCNVHPQILSQMRNHAMATQLSGKRTVEALLLRAESIHQADEDWEGAIELYKDIMRKTEGEDHNEVATASQWRQVWMGFSRCFYELGMYDNAIGAGMAALEMNRHFPHVHTYVALAQSASGDHAKAVKTMKNAVLYEAPWSDGTMQVNKKLLQDFTNTNSHDEMVDSTALKMKEMMTST